MDNCSTSTSLLHETPHCVEESEKRHAFWFSGPASSRAPEAADLFDRSLAFHTDKGWRLKNDLNWFPTRPGYAEVSSNVRYAEVSSNVRSSHVVR